MKHVLLSRWLFMALSLLVISGAQAQTNQDMSNVLVTPQLLPLSAPSLAQASQSVQSSAHVSPNPDALPDAITRQRQALAMQRSAIGQAEAAQQTVCWQKFAVNACLSQARRARRQALAPLRQQELALNAQERLWRTEQRERRLQTKQVDTRDIP